ncbi:serine hydrolase domain-containing protein [Novipirellula artificiosorum]|uniref:Beta-lactamase n=1 Tax=Novipirellula artificiosorum TaxID=2528016 RepID=A0A5C6DZB3_9BACT|nr:serine hydrolase domain-containing protein [Novipirellula artificiosorum]TWU41765.1 Beta-lactamase precursor [Novipirellula artificiosorum]
MYRQHQAPPEIAGTVEPGFESVRVEFERNFRDRGERGAACTLFHQGRKVVHLWGGQQCAEGGHPWTPETLTLCFSVTKGMAAAAMAVAHSQGLFDLETPVAEHWPDFAQANKHRITIRQLLAHQAGLITTGRPLSTEELSDHDAMAEIIAAQSPQWDPGTRHGYHTLTLGWYQNELLRRVDPQGRSLGVYFQDEVATPLGVEFYIGLPEDISPNRVSTIKGFHRLEMLGHLNELPPMMVLSGIWPGSLVSKSIRTLRLQNPADMSGPEYRGLEIPSANGIGTASAVAKIYDCLARGGKELGIKGSTWHELVAPAISPRDGLYDAILKIDTRYHFGFSRPSRGFQFGSDHRAFGCPGAGGSFGMGDPTLQLGFAYLTNKMGFRLSDDPREKAVRDACYACLAQTGETRRVA